jgi:predicted metalloprotease with PDZ domain
VVPRLGYSRAVHTAGLRAILGLVLALLPGLAFGQSLSYRLSFDERARESMTVELTIDGVSGPFLDLRMSRSSPGRYGPHDFASRVSDVEISSLDGKVSSARRTGAGIWRVEQPGTAIRVRYRVTGNRIDGTYFAIDDSHAHINIPATLMWARGLEQAPVTVRFDLPADSSWRIATQLFPGADERTFTAPNLQYLMDSPTEVSAFSLRTFTAGSAADTATFRLAVHHDGTETDVDTLLAGVERIVREARGVFGEFPRFDGGTYTFIADYLPRASDDGMEHRNSTILTSSTPLRADMTSALGTVSHEFFHAWNVERIRPRSLEPFDLTRVNPSNELWLAEGFTQYYGSLLLARAGLLPEAEFAGEMSRLVGRVLSSQARAARSLEQMSALGAVVDSPTAVVPFNVSEVFLSYYTWGGAVALALDLSLRERTEDRVTLDDFMRLLWERFGRPGGAPGVVDRPYSADDLRTALADVSGDRRFADDFFSRYIQGRETADYERLLARVGLVLRRTGESGGRPTFDVVPGESTERPLTDAQRRARAAWLTSRAER